MAGTSSVIDELLSTRATALAGAALRVGASDAGISFAFGLPDPTSLPRTGITQATARALAGDGGDWALQYGSARGQAGLMGALLDKLARDQRIQAGPDNLIITNGSFQAIELLAQAFIDPGDVALVEAPTWSGAVMIYRRAGARLVAVPTDEEGLDLAALERTLDELQAQGTRPKFLYTMPTFHNPRGVTMPLARRERLVALARARGLPLIEDDAYFDLRFRGEHLPTLYSLDGGQQVVYLGTFSKILAAGMRLGWAVGNPDIIGRLVLLKNDTGSNPFSQHVAEQFARTGELRAHIDGLVEVYRDKCAAMLAALDEHMPEGTTWSRPDGGFFVWVTLPAGVDAADLQRRASALGVDYLPGSTCYGDGRGGNELRLAFSFVDAAQIRPGVALLGRAILDAQRQA